MDKEKNASTGQKDSTQQMKLLLILVLCVAVVVPFLSTTLAVNSISSKLSAMKNSSPLGHGESPAEGEIRGKMVFYKPMEFLVNLADTEVSHYLRTTVSLGTRVIEAEKKHKKKGGHGSEEEPQPEIFQRIKAQEPIIRDVIISVISTYPMAALVSAQGKRELKETIRERLQKQLGTENLSVYFTAFTLQ